MAGPSLKHAYIGLQKFVFSRPLSSTWLTIDEQTNIRRTTAAPVTGLQPVSALFCNVLHASRRRCLASAEVHAAFVQFGTLAHNQFNIAIGQYVIMPDHVHLFVRGADEFVLGRWTGTLKQALAKAGNFSRTVDQIWQEGFFDHVLRSDESYARANANTCTRTLCVPG